MKTETTDTPFKVELPMWNFDAMKIYKKLFTEFTVNLPEGYKAVKVKIDKKNNQVKIKLQPK